MVKPEWFLSIAQARSIAAGQAACTLDPCGPRPYKVVVLDADPDSGEVLAKISVFHEGKETLRSDDYVVFPSGHYVQVQDLNRVWDIDGRYYMGTQRQMEAHCGYRHIPLSLVEPVEPERIHGTCVLEQIIGSDGRDYWLVPTETFHPWTWHC